VAYERFAEQRVARGQAMPAWEAYAGIPGVEATAVLPDSEKEIWAEVAAAVQRTIPFVITDEVIEAMAGTAHGNWTFTRAIRAAAMAAGFRVEER
jgi:hypothetical protein